METNVQTFRHSSGKLILLFFGVLLLGFFAFSFGQRDYFLYGITGFAFFIALLYATSSVKISSEEITTNRLLGSKSLRWSEIARVSVFGQAVKLHNYDDDLVLSIDSQLDGYADILDIIFSKRSDLLDKNEDTVLTSSWLGTIAALGFGLFIMALPIYVYFVSKELDAITALFFLAVGLFVLGGWFLSPKRVALENKSLIVGYLYKEVPCSVDDINSISLEKQRTRNGYVYFVQVNLRSGKKIKLSAFKQGAPLAYQILKRWHKKAASS